MNLLLHFHLYTDMKMHSLSTVIIIALLLIAGGIFLANYNDPYNDKGFVIIPVVLAAVFYAFQGPIDHWWREKYPREIDPKLKAWLVQYFQPYLTLNDEDKKRFENRLTLYIEGRLFQGVGKDHKEMPYDICGIIAAHGVLIGLWQKDYLIGEFDRIYTYKHPFPTPDHPYMHNVEVNTEDGVIILSLEQLTNAILSPDEYYNIGFHAYAEAFIFAIKDIIYPDVMDTWSDIERISGWDKENILNQIGLKEVSLLPIHISLFLTKSAKYREIRPDLYEKWLRIFPFSGTTN